MIEYLLDFGICLCREEQLFSVQWRPAPLGMYPNRGQSPKRTDGAGGVDAVAVPVTAPVKPKSAPYRPPGSTGALSDLIKRESGGGAAPIGKVKPVGSSVTKAVAAPAPPQRKIPGLAPAPAPAPAAGWFTLNILVIDIF